MEPRRHHHHLQQQQRQQNGLSYSNLFNLESLMSFQVPQLDDGFHSYGDSSQDESRSSQGRCNGAANGRSLNLNRRRKRRTTDSETLDSPRRDAGSAEEDDEDYETPISEEQYREMLGEHVQKYRRLRYRDSSSGLDSNRMVMPDIRRGHGTRVGKFSDKSLAKEEIPRREVETSLAYCDADFDADYGGGNNFTSSSDSNYLDIGEGITYQIPPTYDKLVTSLKLPSFSDIRIEDFFLKGSLDLRSLAAMVATERKFDSRNRGGLGEPQSQYESLQARLKALSSINSDQKFTLQVSDIGLDPFSIPEGAAGRIRRSILSDSGNLQVYYVKVLEKGDTYEIIERSLPKKQIVKKDPSAIEREEKDKITRVWNNIVRRDIPKYHRIFTNLHRKQLMDAKRFSETCQREVKLKVSRSLRLMRSAAVRTRKLARDMLIFWKKVDKEQAELRKKEERDAAEALKREEEAREAKRQQQRLNFLISQTELYSHFMSNKPAPQSAETLLEGESKHSEGELVVSDTKGGEEEEDPDEAELKREALQAAQKAVSKQKMKTFEFDNEYSRLRQEAEVKDMANDLLETGSSNIDLLHPSTMPVASTVQTPEMFKGRLKDYQLKGLQWLVNCYEQGLNGILADEMGLGKTIQAMTFLSHLAEEKNIWGPFLVVAPSSVLNNWADEVSRFCPDLKTLPYWGGLSERKVLRKNINARRLYRKDSPFHILITSYQLLVADEKHLRKIKWQYMVLDEAQAIKSANSLRWKTLLSFNCRNRLLLTGTPIQNNMAELWALLHFIMPTLFDSHEQFNEWFSKGIESHAEHGGTLNEHQLNRLHAVLKPFMLRRVKKDVISEMTGKTEVTVHCKLSSTQQAFYRAIKNKISLAELLDGSRGHLNDKKIVNLMNIVIQLRKVCNHPELFERNGGSSYFHFADIRNSLLPSPHGGPEDVDYAGERNPIVYEVPKLVYQDIVRNSEMPSSATRLGLRCEIFERLFDIFSPRSIYLSTLSQSKESYGIDNTFGFTRLMNLSPVEVSYLAKCSLLERLLFSIQRLDKEFIDNILDLFMDAEGVGLESEHLDKGKVRVVSRMLLLPTKSQVSLQSNLTDRGYASYPMFVTSHQNRFFSNIELLRAAYAFIPRARAPPIRVHSPDRSFAYQTTEEFYHPLTKKLLLGYAWTSEFNGPRMPSPPHHLIEEILSEKTAVEPILQLPYQIFGSSLPMWSFDPAKMLSDSGKLQTLDILLKRLRAENHRVLLFAQMTKMLDILEDYMNYRKYKYFRLDGSSSIADRRDMVRDFQERNDIFVFLLSTRAGGLGINLTAADTVIFYESDWNPTLDLQAMDRAHRLGQTKEVTVYRLICKETIEEKILQRASQKNTVQQLVMTGGHVQGDLLKTEDVVSLLLDDAQLEQKLKEIPLQQAKERQKKRRVKGVRVDEDGDVTLEDLANADSQGAENDEENHVSKKRKDKHHKQTRVPQQTLKNDVQTEFDEPSPTQDEEDQATQQMPKRLRRPTKSVNEKLEPVFGANSTDYQLSSYDYTSLVDDAEQQEGMASETPPMT